MATTKKKVSNTPLAAPKALSYGLNSIKELEFYHKDPGLLNISNFQRDKIRFAINCGLNWREQERIFEIALRISFLYPANDSKIENTSLFGINALISYNIKNHEGKFVSKKDGSFDMPTKILITFFSIALSTTRGMLASNTPRTAYKDIHLPIVNPQRIITDLWGDILNNPIVNINLENRIK